MPAPRRSLIRPVVLAVLVAGLVATTGAAPVAAADPPPSEQPSAEPSPAPTAAPSPEPSPSVDPTPPAEPSPSVAPSPSGDAGPTPAPTETPGPGATDPPTPAAWSGAMNVYRSSAWVRQYWDYTCTAASTQTMLNLVLGRSNRTSILQQRIIRYARRHDSLRDSRGSDPAGWARALTYFGAGSYSWRVFASRASALRYAASRIVTTGKPVGLLVWRGRHAWTMTGFRSATNPAKDPAAVISGIYVAPPLLGVDPRPNTYLRAGSLGTFARYGERDGLRAWVGRWVVVAP